MALAVSITLSENARQEIDFHLPFLFLISNSSRFSYLLEKYAKERGISFTNRNDLLNNEKIYRLIESHVEEKQKDLASYEKIKKFTLLSQPFTMESRELTDTLKLRRPVILLNYSEQIEKMYEE